MKRLLTVLLVLCALARQGFGQAGDSLVGGSLTASAGSFFGGMNEFVYEKGASHELSRLEWEEYLVPCLGLAGKLRVWGFYLDAGVKSAVPVKSGAMRDYDYMNQGDTEPSHFSEHDAMLDYHFEADARLSARFSLGHWYLAPGAGIFYRARKWSAVDGYTKYPTDGGAVADDTAERDLAGTIITYQETTWMPSASLDVGFLWGGFEAGLRGVYYPWMSVATVDTHIMREPPTRYHDTMTGTGLFAVAGEGWVSYRPGGGRLGFTLGGGWQGVFPARGDTDAGTVGYNTELEPDSASQSRSESSVFWGSLGVVFYF